MPRDAIHVHDNILMQKQFMTLEMFMLQLNLSRFLFSIIYLHSVIIYDFKVYISKDPKHLIYYILGSISFYVVGVLLLTNKNSEDSLFHIF